MLPCRFVVAEYAQKTLKYLLAMATGTPCVHPNWIKHCHEQNCTLPFTPYLLPSGYSLLRGEEVCITQPYFQIFQGIRMMVHGSPMFVGDWEVILRAAGADTVACPSPFPRKNCDVVVAESSISEEYKEFFQQLHVPLVSREWAMQCLINQQVISFTPSNSTQNLSVLYH